MPTDAPAVFEIETSIAIVTGLAITACFGAIMILVRRHRRGLPLVPARPHPPVPWDGSDVLVVVLGFLLVASAAATITGPEPPLGLALAAQLVTVTVMSTVACGWLRARGASLSDLGLCPARPREDVAIAVVGLALVLAPLLFLNAWLHTIMPYEHPVIDLLTMQREAWTIGLVIFTACVAAPIGEELFFRRILQGWLEKVIPSGNGLPGVVVASVAFAAAHSGQGLAYVPLFPLGVVLGVLAWQTGSILPSILLHALFNAVSVTLLLAGIAEA